MVVEVWFADCRRKDADADIISAFRGQERDKYTTPCGAKGYTGLKPPDKQKLRLSSTVSDLTYVVSQARQTRSVDYSAPWRLSINIAQYQLVAPLLNMLVCKKHHLASARACRAPHPSCFTRH